VSDLGTVLALTLLLVRPTPWLFAFVAVSAAAIFATRPGSSEFLAVGWIVTGLLTIIVVGFLLFPVMIVLSFVPFVHMAYAAYKVSQGVDYRYPLVSDLIGGDCRASTL
jgi:uncharacterized Tic20 family protein